ncbi:hypothetical protein LOZ52_003843 [Ophidiomyces ophidiicola]|uniref:uncharacterized protein n=1 Tax=Ophidiomyces ophidiicola TaxID=1387563 RepID=UPI0020C33364|nr:uncharacterized protein LOZ57_005985 [Ophidiomyces ophidiicola]KAI1940293.1 hypothetical protein LOZ57_005985 [Ophidiomyces ophidiicola]KAI2012181.1 hypothetical protein LOZ49_002794 [Ophidiomyces ophidiicola]KAI2056503.1 hypothetical protein LOZ43_003413 [Ophidiomyces ophidiicola]KAI2136392.1 hypothetical protein LOZ29_003527 [Ophidiomyces ophidiicola]KAI2139679.1 hypothetical protein LOZ28_003101 [Ophidiomyces ophidiicola]
MDLIALATDDELVHVFRLNGQKVFGGFSRGPNAASDGLKVNALRWKGNGQLLAVATSDNNIRMLSAYSGKTVHILDCNQKTGYNSDDTPQEASIPPSGTICCLGWGVNLTDEQAASKTVKESQGRLSLDDLLAPETPLSKLPYIKADLPRELALLDIDRSLPKLSTLPSTGDDDDIFSTRASIDSIFHSNSKNSDSVDVVLAGFNDGSIHLRIFDSFEIGTIQATKHLDGFTEARVLAHASHPMSSTHSFLFATKLEEEEKLWIFSLDLLFITKSGIYLSVLASKVTQLQNLMRYIKQVQTQVLLEWKNTQDLPGRYLRNINEDLQEKMSCNFVTAAYHLVVTGDCYAPLKEFLVDQVGERGHKRWEKAVMNGYETIRRLTHGCLLPALERCSVLLGRLIGLSRFYKLGPVLGLNTKSLKACLATVDCLTLLGHKVMVNSGRELTEFIAFSKWLRYEIDLQTAGHSSATAEELMEKADTINHAQTLNYIRGPMTRSSLLDYIQPRTAESPDGRWKAANDLFYENYKTLLRQLDPKSMDQKLDIPVLGDLTGRLDVQFDEVFKRVGETQQRSIIPKRIKVLGKDYSTEIVDLTMNYGDYGGRLMASVYTVSRSKTCPHSLYLCRVVLATINGVSTTEVVLNATINLGSGIIRDVKFVQDGTMMLLWSDGDTPATKYLVHFAYQPDKDPLFCPRYGEDENVEITYLDVMDPSSYHFSFVRHTFSHEDMDPLSIEVNGRHGRRVVCVLYSDRQWYSVHDIDSVDDRDEPGEEEEEPLGQGNGEENQLVK